MIFYFKHLKMCSLGEYTIPTRIRDLEIDGALSDLIYYKDIYQMIRTDASSYFDFFKSLLYMEEMAESKHVAQYDLEVVRLKVHSAIDQTFKIEFNVILFYYISFD